MSEDHYLYSYLSIRLPELGLDVDTYAPYVCSDDDDVDFDEIIELLKASSETHSEDDEVWESFKIDIEKRRQDFVSGETARKELEAMEIQNETQAKLQKEIEISQQNVKALEEQKKLKLESNKVENMSAAKRALMAQYGYEDGETSGTTDDAEKPVTNKDHASAVSKANTQKQRATTNTQSKADARAETKASKAAKEAKKEERRKKAGKKERQRM